MRALLALPLHLLASLAAIGALALIVLAIVAEDVGGAVQGR